MQEEHGGAGVFEFPLQEHHNLDNPNWKYDAVPEFLDGKNIADYIDPEIEEKLKKLEEEEEALLAEEGLKMEDNEVAELNEEQKEALNDITMKVGEIRVEARLNRNKRVNTQKGDINGLKAKLLARGKTADKLLDKVKKASQKKKNKINIEGNA